jgi:hypothetical protein
MKGLLGVDEWIRKRPVGAGRSGLLISALIVCLYRCLPGGAHRQASQNRLSLGQESHESRGIVLDFHDIGPMLRVLGAGGNRDDLIPSDLYEFAHIEYPLQCA